MLSSKNKQTRFTKTTQRNVIIVSLLISSFILSADKANAGFLDSITKSVFADDNTGDKQLTVQSMPLLTAQVADATSELGDYITQDEGALISASGPSGSIAEMTDLQAETAAGQINTYLVEDGDTLQSVANKYGISVNTIVWANNLNRKEKLKPGKTLVILPITSVKHKVAKGDTIPKIAKRYKGDVNEIIAYNGLDDGKLIIGDTIIIPDGELPAPIAPNPKLSAKSAKKVAKFIGGDRDVSGFLINPAPGTRRTQGVHGHNGVDLAGAVGTPLRAAAAGTVIVANVGGYGGGYGNYVVIKHANGTQTLYGHMNTVDVSVGQSVGQGQYIGTLGNTGRSTGPHIHFEVRGAKNPF